MFASKHAVALGQGDKKKGDCECYCTRETWNIFPQIITAFEWLEFCHVEPRFVSRIGERLGDRWWGLIWKRKKQ